MSFPNKYATIILLLCAEVTLFIVFKDRYGRTFQSLLPTVLIAEVGYATHYAKALMAIRAIAPRMLSRARLRLAPAAVGVFGFVGVGLGLIDSSYFFAIGIASALLTAAGKMAFQRYFHGLALMRE